MSRPTLAQLYLPPVCQASCPLLYYPHTPLRYPVYILGAEDAGLPKKVLQACHSVVSLPSERYASYNVAMAGSIVMYDRLAKERRRNEREE